MSEPTDPEHAPDAPAAPDSGSPGHAVGDEGDEVERVDRRLLELLVCPITKTSLAYDEAAQELISRKARLAFPIRRGVPHLVASEARHLDD